MSSMESLRDVKLRPWPASKQGTLSQQKLYAQIEQLTTERAHLRDITKTALQEALGAGKDIPDGVALKEKEDEEKKEKKEVVTQKVTRETIFNAQREMYSHLEWAKFAATNALDLLSLVLSQDPNKRVASSFSHTFREQGLEQGIPFGSFGISKESHEYFVPRPEEAERLEELAKKQLLVAKGSRMEALDSAADEILKAAKKLEKEVRRETKYWQEIVSVSDKGWPIQRLRQNARHVPFGVRFGLPEASDHFKARGFAPLRMSKDGSIILDPALALKPKTFRVRVTLDGETTGTSQLSVQQDMKDNSIEKSIQLARDSLFEEELYHEMSMETRQLLAYGVEFRDSVIQLDVPRMGNTSQQLKLLIDCIPRDEPIAESQSQSHNWLAQNVAEGLRLLLAHEHSMRLYRRSQVPPPLTARAQEKPPPPLLRTLLAVFRHLESVDSLYVYLETLKRTLDSAGLEMGLETTREVSWAKAAESLKTPKVGLSTSDQLLEIFNKPFDGKASIVLPTASGAPSEILSVVTRTVLAQPIFGTEHKLTLPASLTAELGLSQTIKFSSVDELTSYLDWILSSHIVHRIIKGEYSSRAVIKDEDTNVTILGQVSKKGSSASKKDVSIEVCDGSLKMKVTNLDCSSGSEGNAETSHSWDGSDDSTALKELLRSCVG
ncbi:hypothetical protein LEMA_P073790.1 [Plenodomus lingam JN3]|uniref:Mediator of RNA polymerase II transcription subunit 17 n=1 Tax=Leptosphaeria maculans (strain JN3 / isolate v23.1.3 / race Av1-4-5-6-7-8) TaxID=985895 RepID=E5A845_LEPMJ|nr:hypothetical protein LEMA_P073790.1 [Plenodomus lingam JN3]CBX99790.1 hypothetical protein LEMA_P073790.1 [Plenodomus lingam JN3]